MSKNKAVSVSCLILMLFVIIGAFPLGVFAAEDGSTQAGYYMSYKKYVEAENPDGSKTVTYNEITDQISNLLEEGLRRYQSGADRGTTRCTHECPGGTAGRDSS